MLNSENCEALQVVKKLKLVGYPYKIFRNTAMVKDMFTTSVEVARFRFFLGDDMFDDGATSATHGAFLLPADSRVLHSEL